MPHNKVVWKYDVGHDNALLGEPFVLDMPVGAEVLTVALQGERPVMWALVDPKVIQRGRRFRLVMTGRVVQGLHRTGYVGTIMSHGAGTFVFHLFEMYDDTGART